MKTLPAADGPVFTKDAARHRCAHIGCCAEPPQIHVVYVRTPIPLGSAAASVDGAAIEIYQQEESQAALAVAEKELNAAKVPHLGCLNDIAGELAHYARKNRIDLVVMGSHGEGALRNLVLGSVATKCIATMDVPVMTVRRAMRPAASERDRPVTSAAKATAKPPKAIP
jgi:nucleotide-binding universal stress UspA family protein